MELLWSPFLYLLVVVPLLAALYIWMQLRRRRFSLRYSSLALVKDAGARRNWKRHIPPALFLLALTLMLIALARPIAKVRLPSQDGIIVLALDSSGSMRADDIKPNRFAAAKAAAQRFIEQRDPSTEIGIVAFGGSAALVQPPTNDRDELLKALNRLSFQRGTAIGSAIEMSLKAIEEAFADDAVTAASSGPVSPTESTGTFAPAIIVLLTDGQSNRGPDPLSAAEEAAARGIRIYTIGAGTPEGTVIQGFSGRGFRTELDEATLRGIADLTQGEYFVATNEAQLAAVYENLGRQLILRVQLTELTVFFTGAALLLYFLGGTLGFLWLTRLP